MILNFSTKRDINGNRYYLAIDTDKKVFSRFCSTWYSKADVITITQAERRKLISDLEISLFVEINNI